MIYIYSSLDTSFHPAVSLDAGAAVLKLATTDPWHFLQYPYSLTE